MTLCHFIQKFLMRNACVECQVLIRQVNVVQVQFDQLIFIFCIAVRCLQSIDRRAQLYLLPAAYIVCGKVMFPVVSVSLSTRRGVPCNRSHGAWHAHLGHPPVPKACSNLFTLGHLPPPDNLFKLVHLGTFHLPGPIETCSLGDAYPTSSNLLVSGRLVLDWKAFLCWMLWHWSINMWYEIHAILFMDVRAYYAHEPKRKHWWYLLSEKLTGSRMKFVRNGKGININ